MPRECLKILTLLILISVNPLAAVENYELHKSIQVYNTQTKVTSVLKPGQGHSFEVLDPDSTRWYYKLRILDKNGKPLSGPFISAKSNITNGFILKRVVERANEGLRTISSAGNPSELVCLTSSLRPKSRPDRISLQAPAQSTRPRIRPEQISPQAPAQSIRPSQRPENLTSPVTSVDPKSSCDVEGTSDDWKQRCAQLYQSNIPKAALEYALKVMRLNASSFKTDKCFKPDTSGARENSGLKPAWHPSMRGLTANGLENDLLQNGLKNKCQIIINDTDDRSLSPKGDNCRGKMFYIDLCSPGDAVVKEDYFNLGTGTCRGGKYGFRNGSQLHTTVKGAFFTHNKTFDFTDVTRQKSQYQNVARKVSEAGGQPQATAIQLFGLQNTNNLASRTGKYMHVSPHRSSWGCPSVRPSNYYMIEALANNGPSLVPNWGREGMEEIERCTR